MYILWPEILFLAISLFGFTKICSELVVLAFWLLFLSWLWACSMLPLLGLIVQGWQALLRSWFTPVFWLGCLKHVQKLHWDLIRRCY